MQKHKTKEKGDFYECTVNNRQHPDDEGEDQDEKQLSGPTNIQPRNPLRQARLHRKRDCTASETAPSSETAS